MSLLDQPPMMNLHTKAPDFLERAEALRKHRDAPSLLYAALELRCGIEARLMEYAAYAVGVSKRNAGQKEIARLGKTIDSAYELGDTIVVVLVRMHSGSTAQFLYAPVTARVREIGKRCGDYPPARFHATGRPISADVSKTTRSRRASCSVVIQPPRGSST